MPPVSALSPRYERDQSKQIRPALPSLLCSLREMRPTAYSGTPFFDEAEEIAVSYDKESVAAINALDNAIEHRNARRGYTVEASLKARGS